MITASVLWCRGHVAATIYSLYLVHFVSLSISLSGCWRKHLVMDNFSLSLPSPDIPSPCPSVFVDVLFQRRFVDLLVSSTLTDPQVCRSQQCGTSPWCWKQARGSSSAAVAKGACSIITRSSRQWPEKVPCLVLVISTKGDKRQRNEEWFPKNGVCLIWDQNTAFLKTYLELQR